MAIFKAGNKADISNFTPISIFNRWIGMDLNEGQGDMLMNLLKPIVLWNVLNSYSRIKLTK